MSTCVFAQSTPPMVRMLKCRAAKSWAPLANFERKIMGKGGRPSGVTAWKSKAGLTLQKQKPQRPIEKGQRTLFSEERYSCADDAHYLSWVALARGGGRRGAR